MGKLGPGLLAAALLGLALAAQAGIRNITPYALFPVSWIVIVIRPCQG